MTPTRSATAASSALLRRRHGSWRGAIGSCAHVILFHLLLGLATAGAQELTATAATCLLESPAEDQASRCDVAELSLAYSGVRIDGTTAAVELGYRSDGDSGRGAAQVGIALAANESFSLLGNVVFELAGDVRTDGLAQGTVGARGVLGPVAASLTLGAYGADAGVFEPLAIADDERISVGGFSAGLQLGLSGRLTRNAIVSLDPEVYVTGDGLVGRLAARLRLLRALGENELRLHLFAGTSPGFEEAYGSLGAGVLFPRGRSPDIEFGVSVGIAAGRVAPGASVTFVENLAGGTRLSFDAAFEPWRRDVHPGRATAAIGFPVAGGTLRFALAGAVMDPLRPAAVVVQTSYQLPLGLGETD